MLTSLLYKGSYAALTAILVATRFVIIPSNVQMGLITASILFIGAHQSLKLNEIDAATGKRAGEADTISKKDAMMFPVFGSIALVSLYVCYKYVGKEYMNLLLTTYIMLAGVAAVANTIAPAFQAILPAAWFEKKHGFHFNIPSLLRKLADGQAEFRMQFGKADIVTHLTGLALAGYFLQTKDFTIHNLFGMAFSIQAIKLISLGQFLNGFILLWGLFVYDIFWVFGTDVMVTVAKSLDGPIKILFPRSLVKDPVSGRIDMSLLGLGDIVLPGFFLALLLRFDAHVAKLPVFPTNIHASFPKPYFHSGLLGYVIGLGTTLYVMIGEFWAGVCLL